MRFAKVLGTSVDLWLNLQLAWDLYEAQHSPKANEIERLEKIAS
jgi:plasmid maintenance system antidote protein VapI